jgi:hypothetical protein
VEAEVAGQGSSWSTWRSLIIVTNCWTNEYISATEAP